MRRFEAKNTGIQTTIQCRWGMSKRLEERWVRNQEENTSLRQQCLMTYMVEKAKNISSSDS